MMLLMELLLLASFVVMLAWYPCCCDDGVPAYVECAYCDGTGDNAPQYMTVELAGIANDECTECDNYNGTYVLENIITNPCYWRWRTESDLSCDVATYEQVVLVYSAGLGTILHVNFYQYTDPDANIYNFYEGSPSTACLELTDVDIPYNAMTANGLPDSRCDFSSSTCTVTSGDTT